MMWGDGWGWIVGGLMMLLFWGGLMALVVFLVRGAFGSRPNQIEDSPRGRTAQEILAQRFARGEISEEEFEQRKQVLEREVA